MPCVETVFRLRALRTIMGLLDEPEHPAWFLALYFLGPSHRVLVPGALDNLYASTETAPPSNQAGESLHRRLATCPQIRGFPPPRRGIVPVATYADDVSLFLRDSGSLVTAAQHFHD